MLKNVIFDIGNVIAYIDYNETLEKMIDNEEEKKFIMDNIVNSPEWGGYGLVDIGFLTWDEIIEIIQDRTNHTHDDLVERYCHEHYNYLDVQNKMLSLIKDLIVRGYKVYLLSNTNEDATNHLRKSELFDIVHGYVLSHEVHQIKPYTGIYKTLINKYNLKKEESLFVDDRLDNCETAKSLGIDYINVLPDNYDDLINKLTKKVNL